MAAARRAQAPLRRRGRRSRLARARDRVLPREAARHPRRLRARQVVHRLGRRGAEHDDHPLQLPHARGRRVLPRERAPVRAPLCRARLQPHVLPARPPHARALGPRARDDAGAGRGEQAARDQVERRRPAGDPRALPAARRLGSPVLSDPGRALPRSGRDHPARRRRLGLRAGRRPARGRDPPEHGGHGLRARRRPRRRRRDAARPHRVRAGRVRDRRLVVARRRARARAAPDHDAHPPGLRHRADEAVPRRDHRLLAAARVHLADRPRRVPDRRRDRAVHDLQGNGHALLPRVLLEAHARALPAARADQDAPHLDRALRPLARLQPAPRQDRDRQLPPLGRLGDVRVQGGADRRRDARASSSHRERPRT